MYNIHSKLLSTSCEQFVLKPKTREKKNLIIEINNNELVEFGESFYYPGGLNLTSNEYVSHHRLF